MATLAVTRATDWATIEAAASAEGVFTCIQPEGHNWQKAKETWELHSDREPDVIYFTVHIPNTPAQLKGYVRFLKASAITSLRPTWVLDYLRPAQYGVVALAAAEVPGTVLVRKFGTTDDPLVRCWPAVSVALPKLDQYPYHTQPGTECEWLVVPGIIS